MFPTELGVQVAFAFGGLGEEYWGRSPAKNRERKMTTRWILEENEKYIDV